MSGHVTTPEKWQTFSKASLNGSECNLNNTNSRNASITGSITYIVAIGKPEWQVREASHCGSKQQQISDHSIIAYSCHIHLGVILRGHPVRGDSHIQRNANREVATIEIISSYAAKYF